MKQLHGESSREKRDTGLGMALGSFPACAQAWTHQAEQKPHGQRNPLLQVPQGACLLDGPTLQPHIPYASDPISCCSCLLPGAGDELGYQHLALPTLLRCSGAVPKGEGPAVPGLPWVWACPPCQAVLLPPNPPTLLRKTTSTSCHKHCTTHQ